MSTKTYVLAPEFTLNPVTLFTKAKYIIKITFPLIGRIA